MHETDQLRIACPNCDKRLRAKAALLGKRVKCPSCSKFFEVKAEDKALQEAHELTLPKKSPLVEDGEEPQPKKRRAEVAAPRKTSPSVRNDHEDDPHSDVRRPSKRAKVLILMLCGGTTAILLVVVTAFLWPGFLRSPRPVSRPGLLGHGVLLLPKPDLEKVNKRLEKVGKDVLDPYFGPWETALRGASQDNYDRGACTLALVLFVPQLDALWENEQLQPSRLNLYIKRLEGLPPKTIRIWEEELNKITRPLGGGVRDLDTIGFLIQMDVLFAADGTFRSGKSDVLLTRLRSLTPDAVKSRSKAIDAYTEQAAVMMIQE